MEFMSILEVPLDPVAELRKQLKRVRRLEYEREYRQRPEVRAKISAYHREYSQSPEFKAKQREYKQRPEVKAKRRAYRQTPENKHRQALRMRAYRQTPRGRLREAIYHPIPAYVNRGLAMLNTGELITQLKDKMK